MELNDPIIINGINAATGSYLIPAGDKKLTIKQLAKLTRKEKLEPDHKKELEKRLQKSESHLGLAEGLDAKNLSETGWGVIFAYDDPNVEPIREALSPLLNLRKQQVNNDSFYKEFIGPAAYRSGESKMEFLSRHGSGPGPVNPKEGVPYYLLIVGSPELIPYSFQYQLDVQFAVGRICFATPQEYDQYARSIVAAETGKVVLPRRATFFGVRNPDDRATQLSADHLIKPLAEEMSASGYLQDADWQFTTILAEEAKRARLERIIGGDETPAFTLVASHGVGFPNGHQDQLRHQGALLCQGWTGPYAWKGPITEDLYFAGDHIVDSARLLGMIAFFFACYGAGTPRWDDFTQQAYGDKEQAEIAPHAFLAQLPQQMLGHPHGGALAVVGHVERAWGYSFMWGRAGRQLATFRSTLKRLMDGYPIGAAIEYFNERYAEIASEITNWQSNDYKGGYNFTPADLQDQAMLWTANHDARNYAVIGDPAVRLPVGNNSFTSREQLVIDPTTLTISFAPAAPTPSPSDSSTGETLFDDAADADGNVDDWTSGEPDTFSVGAAPTEQDATGTTAPESTASGDDVEDRLDRIETQLNQLEQKVDQLLQIIRRLSKHP